MENKILGLHHITAIAGNAQRNFDFYTKILGLRLVKKTVNFDDPGTYHFYFGDEIGTPGTILTFFPWANVKPGKNGVGMATDIGYSVPAGSLAFWQKDSLKIMWCMTRWKKDLVSNPFLFVIRMVCNYTWWFQKQQMKESHGKHL